MMPDANTLRATVDPGRPAMPALGTHLARALDANLDKIEEAIKEADPARMIHEARKAMKEYRALLRLVRTPAAKASRMQTARVARTLSAARDLTAARDALALLREDGLIDADEEIAAGSALPPAGGEGSEDAERREALAHFLADTRRLHGASLLADAAGADVLDGLKRGYRQARAGAFGTAEDVHETRKGVVAHRYQMSFYDAIPGCAGERRAAKAQALRDLLGAYQDAHTLDRLLDAPGSGFTDTLRARLRAAIAEEQKALLKKAKRKHSTLFSPAPSAFVKSLLRA